MGEGHAHRVRAGRARLSRPTPRAVLAGCAALLTAALATAGPDGAWAAFTGTTVSTGNVMATAAVFPDYRTAVQDSGPVVYHPFDDPYGSSTAAALVGTTGTYNGAAAASSVASGAIAASAGGPRRAVRFPENAHADANSTTSLTGTVTGAATGPVKLTLEAWVRTGHGGAVVSLLPEGSSATPGRTQLYVNERGQVCVGLTLDPPTTLQEVCGYDAADPKAWTSTDQASPAWHHLVAVIDPSGQPGSAPCGSDGTQVIVYVDGAVAYDRGLCGTWPQTVAGRWRVGTAPITTDAITTVNPADDAEGLAPDAWSGDIDEVAVYTGVLNATEVKKHYDMGMGTVAGNYATSVKAFPALHLYWQLEEQPAPGARTVADASANNRGGTFYVHPDLGVAGAPTGTTTAGTAVGLSGVNDISTGASRTTPAAFSTEVWFRSSGGTGPLASFGSTQTGTATAPYGAVYLTGNGNLAFTIRTPQRTVVSPRDHRDSTWHLVTATMSAGGRMRLYVDGVLVGEDTSSTTTGALTGFWRWGGGGDYSTFPVQPGAALFTGRLDEASVYDRELTPEDVAIHWGASF
jgi:hypothetical protein